MTRRSISVAVLLPSMFAAVVIGAVVLEGRITVTAPIVAAGVPWNIGFALGWLALGLLLDVPLRLAGLPNPFGFGGYLIEAFLNCALIASPIINVLFCMWRAGASTGPSSSDGGARGRNPEPHRRAIARGAVGRVGVTGYCVYAWTRE